MCDCYLAELYARAAKERDELRRENEALREELIARTGATTVRVSYQDTLLGQSGFEE